VDDSRPRLPDVDHIFVRPMLHVSIHTAISEDTEMIESCSNQPDEDLSCPVTSQSLGLLANVEHRTGDRMQLEHTVNSVRCRTDDEDQDQESRGSRLPYSTPLKFGIDRILVTNPQSSKQVALSTG